MSKSKRLCITLSNIEDIKLTEQAQKCGLSKAGYIRDLIQHGQVINSLPEAKIRSVIAELHCLTEQVEDELARKTLKRRANELWQSLK